MTRSAQIYKIDLGTYTVVENKLNVLTIHLGNNVHTHIHILPGFVCTVAPGAKINLFTELPCQISSN